MIENVENTAGFEKLREDWNELLEASASDCLFLTWEWLHTWWKHLAEGRALSVLAVRCDGKLVAIAPFAVRSRKLTYLLPFPSLQFLGTGSVGSNYLDLIIRREKEQEALHALAEYLAKRGLMLELAGVKSDFSFAARLAGELGHSGWRSSKSKINICPFISLSGHSWQSYLATLGSKHRHEFERRLRNLTKQFNVRFEQVRSEEERREALPLLFHLHNMRWRDRGGSEAFCTPSVLSFHQELSQLSLQRGWLRLFVLRLDEKPVAARYGFRYNRTFYSYQSGFDPGYGKYGVGLVARGLTIKSAMEEGAEEFDLLAGNEDYKFRLAREERELARLDLWPPGARGLLLRRAVRLTRKVRRVVRHILPRAVARRMAAGRRAVVWKEPYATSSH